VAIVAARRWARRPAALFRLVDVEDIVVCNDEYWLISSKVVVI
jgi:hypothetical protein